MAIEGTKIDLGATQMVKIEMKSLRDSKLIYGYDEGIKVFNGTGNEMKGICSIDVHARPESIVSARIELYPAEVHVDSAVSSYHMSHPVYGHMKKVKQITFSDNEVWSAE